MSHDAQRLEPAEAAASEATSPASLPRPRTRWAAIVWGLVFLALALLATDFFSDAAHLDGLGIWLLNVEIGTLIAYAVLVVGGLLLIIGLVGLLRKLQLARSTHSVHGSA